MSIPEAESTSNPAFTPPSSLEEAQAILDNILSIQRFQTYTQPFACRSHCVSSKSRRMAFDLQHLLSLSSLQLEQQSNYAIRLNYGLSDTLQISGFYSEADDPLNTQ